MTRHMKHRQSRSPPRGHDGERSAARFRLSGRDGTDESQEDRFGRPHSHPARRTGPRDSDAFPRARTVRHVRRIRGRRPSGREGAGFRP